MSGFTEIILENKCCFNRQTMSYIGSMAKSKFYILCDKGYIDEVSIFCHVAIWLKSVNKDWRISFVKQLFFSWKKYIWSREAKLFSIKTEICPLPPLGHPRGTPFCIWMNILYIIGLVVVFLVFLIILCIPKTHYT